jgi:hypothetical protein
MANNITIMIKETMLTIQRASLNILNSASMAVRDNGIDRAREQKATPMHYRNIKVLVRDCG